jgi:hypothetical protein
MIWRPAEPLRYDLPDLRHFLAALDAQSDLFDHSASLFVARAPGRLDLMGGSIQIDDSRWRGYLANVTPSAWEATFRDHVPSELDGATFLARYGGTTDTVTHVDPPRTYAVCRPTVHPKRTKATLRSSFVLRRG